MSDNFFQYKVIIILSYEPSISLHIQTQRTWLVVPDTDSRMTCSKKYDNCVQLQGFPIDSHTSYTYDNFWYSFVLWWYLYTWCHMRSHEITWLSHDCHLTSAGCYGVPEDDGVDDSRSDLSSFTTVPWFCDTCKAGVSPVACVSSVLLALYSCLEYAIMIWLVSVSALNT